MDTSTSDLSLTDPIIEVYNSAAPDDGLHSPRHDRITNSDPANINSSTSTSEIVENITVLQNNIYPVRFSSDFMSDVFLKQN